MPRSSARRSGRPNGGSQWAIPKGRASAGGNLATGNRELPLVPGITSRSSSLRRTSPATCASLASRSLPCLSGQFGTALGSSRGCRPLSKRRSRRRSHVTPRRRQCEGRHPQAVGQRTGAAASAEPEAREQGIRDALDERVAALTRWHRCTAPRRCTDHSALVKQETGVSIDDPALRELGLGRVVPPWLRRSSARPRCEIRPRRQYSVLRRFADPEGLWFATGSLAPRLDAALVEGLSRLGRMPRDMRQSDAVIRDHLSKTPDLDRGRLVLCGISGAGLSFARRRCSDLPRLPTLLGTVHPD